jgi:tetratricopeptide (TPR) repeat protein
MLAGAAYWFAAHNESGLALALGSKAIEIEPRYTWSQVAVGRALIDQKKPLEAERALRYARQYAKFPTLDYELATALVSAGLYDEAAEILMQSFSVKDNQIEVRLARRASMRKANFIELLAPERQASLFQFVAADTDNNAKTLKALLTFATAVNQRTISEEGAVAAAKEFAAGDDPARVYRQLYAASRLLQKGIGYQTVYDLAEAARNSVDAGLNVPAATIAAQADEYRQIRARAIASGGTPSVTEAPRNLLSNLLRGRIEDISGWSLFNQDKLEEAVDHLKRAANILPEGTPAWRAAWWHLGATLDRMGKKEEALASYVKSYNAGEPDAVRRTVIEQLYRKVNGSLAGLDEQIGSTPAVAMNAATPSSSSVTNETANPSTQPVSSPESNPTPTPVIPAAPAVETSPTPSATPVSDSSPEVVPTPTPSPESPALVEPQPSQTPSTEPASNPSRTPESPALTQPQPSPTPSPEAAPSPTPTPESPAPSTSPTSEPIPSETTPAPRATVRITGMIKDSGNNPIANVVVVLISPLGTVLASTTNDKGSYSFIVVPSAHSYRIIPSKDGFTFEPIDRVLPVLSDDQKELDFIGTVNRRP